MPFPAKTILAAVLLAVLSASPAPAQVWHEGFETSQPSWRNVGGDTQYRILQQQRLQGESHSGNGCEWLRLESERGTAIYIAHDVGRPSVIDELLPSVWVKADRPGVQLAARIVLPRTPDRRTGRPVATIIVGGSYNATGRWQQLQLGDIPRLLARQVRILRMQLGPQVDEHEAYIDAVLLNVYTGPGVSNVWIDDLEVAGHVASQRGEPSAAPNNPAAANNPVVAAFEQSTIEGPLTPIRLPPISTTTVTTSASPQHTVKLERSLLLVDDRPFFPRVIRYRGEPLAVLKKIGFNAVWLPRLAAPEVLEEASRLGLWLICPPPRPIPTAADQPGVTPIADIGSQFDCVLAWDLGDDLTEPELEATQRWAEQIHAADHRLNRPLICRPRTDLRGFSRPANMLLIDRRPLGTSLELDKYATWVRQQPLLASLGTPIWTTVQTQTNEALRQQLSLMEPGYAPPLSVAPEQIRLLAYIAVSSGSRGLVFLSDTPLDAPDPDTRQRAMTLELVNLEMQLLELWAAAGSCVATAEASIPLLQQQAALARPVDRSLLNKKEKEKLPEKKRALTTSQGEVSAALLQTERARLLLPVWISPGAQCVPSESAANSVTLRATFVPKVCDAYELTPHGTEPLRHLPMAGGLSITLDEFGLVTRILLAHDPSIVADVRARAKQNGQQEAQLHRDLALHKLNTVSALGQQLTVRTRVDQAASLFVKAREDLQVCDQRLAAGDWADAVKNAERASRSLRLIERAYWDAAVDPKVLAAPITSPAAMSFDTLPLRWRFAGRVTNSYQLGPNRIDGGDFEDFDTMIRAGWRYIPHAMPTVQLAVNHLPPQARRNGRLGLRLAVIPLKPDDPPAVLESPPILFSSPPVQVAAGQIVCIHGWVNVPDEITASVDGLMVVDSLSGEALADRIGKTNGWRQFVLYRIAPQAGPMCVTFAMTGIGEAWLDDVAIQVLEPRPATAQR
jgi:hypothetical protein